MASLLDLAVVALAILVSCTLLLLAWTLGVSAVRAVRATHRQALVTRLQIAILERRLHQEGRITGDE